MSDDLTRRTPDDTLWTEERIRALGAVTDVPTTASIFKINRSRAYELIQLGEFPVPVLRFGSRYRVPVAAIITALQIPPADDTGPRHRTT